MNKRDAENYRHMMGALEQLGFTYDERNALRRISMTLHRWHELECGYGNQYESWAIERDDNGDGPPYMVHHHYRHGNGKDTVSRRRIADRETGARKRLERIIKARNARVSSTDKVRQTCCKHCGQDIEAFSPFPCGEWRDRGNNTHCPNAAGDAGQCHEPTDTAPIVSAYVQTDPRGAALYILRPGDVPADADASAYYTRGICIY